MISHKHQFIYVHIPKTAGTSIGSAFGDYQEDDSRLRQDHRLIRNIADTVPPWQSGKYRPAELSRFIYQRFCAVRDGVEVVSQQQYESYFKFAFVRNPWERVYSWYRNVMRDPLHQRELNVSGDLSFDNFVDSQLQQWAMRPQFNWLTDRQGNIAVDFVGRFERLGADFELVCNKIGMEPPELPAMLSTGGHTYADAYSDQARRKIAQFYRFEIEYFDYQFTQGQVLR
jgi:hypothetical protein